MLILLYEVANQGKFLVWKSFFFSFFNLFDSLDDSNEQDMKNWYKKKLRIRRNRFLKFLLLGFLLLLINFQELIPKKKKTNLRIRKLLSRSRRTKGKLLSFFFFFFFINVKFLSRFARVAPRNRSVIHRLILESRCSPWKSVLRRTSLWRNGATHFNWWIALPTMPRIN